MTMNTATDKQVSFARKLFAKAAAANARHAKLCGITAGKTFATFEEEMVWLEMDPTSKRDVSDYLNLHVNARHDAAVYLKGR
jgi:hypothetical protein